MSTDPRPRPDARQRLVQAMGLVIARDGFSGAKIQDVVKEARVSLRTFYSEFDNKEALFLELHRQLVSMMSKQIANTVVFDIPWRDVMHRSFAAYLQALTIEPRITHAVMVELATLSDEARAAREQALGLFTDLLIDLVEQGRVEHPEIPSRPLSPLMARAILGGVTELVTSRVVRGELSDLSGLVDTATEMLWSVVTGPEYAS